MPELASKEELGRRATVADSELTRLTTKYNLNLNLTSGDKDRIVNEAIKRAPDQEILKSVRGQLNTLVKTTPGAQLPVAKRAIPVVGEKAPEATAVAEAAPPLIKVKRKEPQS